MTRQGLAQPLVLAGIMATGFVAVWGLVGLWAVEVADHIAGTEAHGAYLFFLPDGTPRIANSFDRYQAREFRDLEGNQVPPPADNDNRSWLGHVPLAATPPRRASGELSWNQRLRSFPGGENPAVYWYFLSEGRPDGTGYFAGYDSQTKTCIGYLGTAGFRQGPLPTEELFLFGGLTSGPHTSVLCTPNHLLPGRHPENHLAGQAPRGSLSTWDIYLLGRDHKIYHADLHNRTVHVARDDPRLLSAAVVAGPSDPVRGTPHWLAVRTDDEVLVLDERGAMLQRYAIPEELRGQELHFANTTTGEALLYWNSPEDELATAVDYRIYWVAADGRSRKAQITLPASGELRKYQVFGGVVVPAPVVLAGLVAINRAGSLLEEGLAPTYAAALERALTEFWPALAVAQLLALLLAIACYRRQAWYGASGMARVVWPLFVLILGLPGWVGYRFGQSWPVLEACPACNTGVPRDRPDCVRCEAEFPRPALKGTEVFV